MKLQKKSKQVTSSRKANIRKVAVIIGALVGVTMLSLPNNETSAWKVPNIMDILKSKDNVTSINQNRSVGEGIQILEEEADTSFKVNSTDEIRAMVSFNFKKLPYEFKEGVIRGPLDGEEIVYLNYISDKGKFELAQMRQGLEFTQSVNIGNDSEVSEIKINAITYSIIKILEDSSYCCK